MIQDWLDQTRKDRSCPNPRGNALSVFRFLGIDDLTFIHAQGVSLAPDARPSVMAHAEAEIERLFPITKLAA